VEVGSYFDSPSPYETWDQGGNLYEWIDQQGNYFECPTRTLRGDSFNLEQRPNISYLESSSRYFECVQKGLDPYGLRMVRRLRDSPPGTPC
jgi:hypothetical protein